MRTIDAVKQLDLASALPARYYFGEDMLAMEHRSVFARSWQLVARHDQLADEHHSAEVGRRNWPKTLKLRGADPEITISVVARRPNAP